MLFIDNKDSVFWHCDSVKRIYDADLNVALFFIRRTSPWHCDPVMRV